jgi:hypothetical protein
MSSSVDNVAPTDALVQLEAALAERRASELAAENARQDHHRAVYAQWAALEPVLSQAVADVNELLVKYAFPAIMYDPGLVNDYVVDGDLVGRGTRCLLIGIRDGNIDVVVTNSGSSGWRVVVGGDYRWDEGWIVPLECICARSLSNALAWAARWRIVEEPSS